MVSTYTHRMKSKEEVIKWKKVFALISFALDPSKQMTVLFIYLFILGDRRRVIIANYIVINLNVTIYLFIY